MPKSKENSCPVFAGGQKVLYCKICSVPPEYCEYMDTPAACDEWLEATYPDVFLDVKARREALDKEREAQIAALEAEKKGVACLDADEAAMLAAMEAEVGGAEQGSAKVEAETDATVSATANSEPFEASASAAGEATEPAKEKKEKKKKKKKTRRGGANNRRQTGIINGTEVQEVTLSRVQRNKRKFVTIVFGLETFGHKLKSAAKKLGKRFACGAAVSVNDVGKEEIVIQGDCLSDLPKLLKEKYEVPIANMYVLSKTKRVPLNSLRSS